MSGKSYWKIDAEQAALIIADQQKAVSDILAQLTELAGVPVHNFDRSGNLAFGIARVDAIHAHEAPSKPGWKEQLGKTGVYLPNRRVAVGRQLEQELQKLDCLGMLSALHRAGVTPWSEIGLSGFSAGVAKIGGQLLLSTAAEHHVSWPEWVCQIKASEFYAIQEAAGEALS